MEDGDQCFQENTDFGEDDIDFMGDYLNHEEDGPGCHSEHEQSTYESITEIQLDDHKSHKETVVQSNVHKNEASCSNNNLNPSIISPKTHDDSESQSNTSYNTVPEEPAPEPAEENSDHSEVKTEEDALLGAEDSEEGCENQRKGGTLQQCTRKSSASKCKNSGSSRKGKALKRKGSKSDVGGKKSKVSHKKETKNEKNASRTPSRNRIITKVVTPRDLIKPNSESKLHDPDVPHRPLTAFKLFMNEFRAKYAAKYPNITFAEMTDIGADVWRDITPEKKAEFQEAANKQQEDYLNEMRAYQAKKQHDRSAKPKTAYQIFMSDYLNKEYEKRKNLKTQSTLTKQDLFMRGVRKWKRMTKTQKKVYEEQARRTRETTVKPYTGPTLPEVIRPKRNRAIKFHQEQEVAQFTADNVLTRWIEATTSGSE